MKCKNLLVHLKNEVDSFSIKQRHLDRMQAAFPGIRLIEATGREDFRKKMTDADWIMTWYFRAEWYEKAPRLEAVFTPAAGHDWVPSDPSGSPTHVDPNAAQQDGHRTTDQQDSD